MLALRPRLPITHVSVAGNPGIWPVFHQRISSWVLARRSSHASRELRHQRGCKIAVENPNPLRKLHDKEVKRAWERHNNDVATMACIRGGEGSKFLSAEAFATHRPTSSRSRCLKR